MHGAALHHHAGEQGGEPRHQRGVVYAAAAGDQSRCRWLRRVQGVDDAARAEFHQRRLHVLRGLAAVQSLAQPAEVELIASAALRRGQGEPRFGQTALQKGGQYLAGCPPGAAGVIRLAGVLGAPRVHEPVRWAGVESPHRAVGRQQGEVADAAEVQHGARLAGVAEDGSVERGHEGGAFAPRGHVPAAEVRHDVAAGALRDDVGIAHLQGEAVGRTRPVPQGLAVRTDRANPRGIDASVVHQGQGRFREGFADRAVQRAEFIEMQRGFGLRNAQDRRAERGVVGRGAGMPHRDAGRGALDGRRNRDQRGIDAVGTGAGNEPDEQRFVGVRRRRCLRPVSLRRHAGQRAASWKPSMRFSWASAGAVARRYSASAAPVSGSGFGIVTVSGLRCTPLTRNS